MYTGPKLTNDNLVFGYDTGHGIADNGTATRFYKGEPATNAQDSDISAMTQTGFNNWGAYDGNNTPYHTYSSTTQTKTLVNIPGPDGELTNAMLYHNVSGGSFGPTNWSGVPSTNLANGSKITLQAWVKAADSSFVGKSVRPHLYYSKVGGGAYSASTNHSLTMDWQLVKHCYTVPEGSTGNGTFYLFTGSGETKMYVTQTAIVPDKLHSVVWLQGGTTRSDTASLIDLKKTTNIDVGNVSFTSTGQPSYDETDDHITGVLPMSGLGQPHTIEMIFSCNVNQSSIGSRKDPFTIGNSTTHQYSALDVNSNNMNWYFYSKDTTFTNSPLMVADQFYHIVLSYAGGYSNNTNKKVWINGVQQTLSSGVNEIPLLPNNPSFSVGRDRGRNTAYWPGEIPVWKVYQKALTQEDAISNYKAYKNRFNL
jgi:hypothetical protein